MKMMKSVLAAAVSLGSVAHANYDCWKPHSTTKLIVKENQSTRIGDTTVVLSSETGSIQMSGNMRFEGGSLMHKKVVQLYPFPGDTLTLVTLPKACGRGSCDLGGGSEIFATLKLGEVETFFNCQFVTNEPNS